MTQPPPATPNSYSPGFGSSEPVLNPGIVAPFQVPFATDTAPNAADTANAALRATEVKKSFRSGATSRLILDEVDFHANAGEIVFLCGPSGSGKSTLLSIMGCLLECDSGEVWIDHERVDHLNEQQKTLVRRNKIGFVFQKFQLIGALNAIDNVAVPLTQQGMPLADAQDAARQLLVRVGLEEQRHQLPATMSPGQCQRVAMARAVVAKPKLLFADEPTAALDGQSGAQVMTLLRELATETGAATVVVTHDPRIDEFADRICHIENGGIL